MKAALGKGWKWLLGIFMSLLGFSGCGKIGIFREEYGSPYAHFKLLGDVKDMKGNPIRGIRVVYDRLPEDETWGKDTLYTDPQGHFEKDLPDFMRMTGTVVRFNDVDGEANGSYRSKVLTDQEIEIVQTKKGDKKWFEGAFTIKADAVLEEDN